MSLLIQCLILAGVFTLMILIPLYKNPIGQIMSYPPEIRKRVENLPQYKGSIKKRKKKHIIIKILSVFIIALILSIIAYYSGARTFTAVCKHVFLLFFFVNIYDLVVMDIGIFCHTKVFRIPGTEDMDKEYKDPRHHIKGALIGTGIGIIVSLLSASYIELLNILKK